MINRTSKGNMKIWLLLLSFLSSLLRIWAQDAYASEGTIIIRGSNASAETSDNFVCATIDWWPPEKCNYNQCPWGDSSILNLDINHPLLAEAIGAFSPLRIRLGGSLQDQVVYDGPNPSDHCHPFMKVAHGLFGFTKGCLSMERWDAINGLFINTGAVVTFGLNALYGRSIEKKYTWAGAWNSTNARDFIAYTISKGYPVDSWEFGNELSGRGIGARVDAEQYGKDLIGFKSILDDLYAESQVKPLLLAPGGFFEQQWYAQLLQVSGPNVIDAMTHHIYNIGDGNDPHLTRKILDPHYLSQIVDIYRSLQQTLERHGPWASAWVGEAGGVANNGGRLVSNTFIDSFWYLDQLGMASKYNTKVYCRQTLIGANYGLLDAETYVPNPDYYSALLWHQLMGKKVLSIDTTLPPVLRAYAHCSRKKAGVTLLLINLSNTTEFSITARNDITINAIVDAGARKRKEHSFSHTLKKAVSWLGRSSSDIPQTREEYHLTAGGGNHLSKAMLLNGDPLGLTGDGTGIPAMFPALVPLGSPISLAPLSIAFVVLPRFEASACL